MREIRLYGSEGGGAGLALPTPNPICFHGVVFGQVLGQASCDVCQVATR